MKNCTDAHRALSDTARLRTLAGDARDPLEDTQRMDVYDRRRRRDEATAQRERRKPETVGERRAAASHARDIISDRQQELIEAGVWPAYTP